MIGMQSIYKDYDKIVDQIHDAIPKFRQFNDFKFAMKIRDQKKPKAWKDAYYDELVMVPHPDDLPEDAGALGNIQESFSEGISSIGDSMKNFFNRSSQNR
jgi:hypothetical protein